MTDRLRSGTLRDSWLTVVDRSVLVKVFQKGFARCHIPKLGILLVR